MDLFKFRLVNIPGARETVSLIINVEIDTSEFVKSSNKKLKEKFKLYEKEKHYPEEDDEYTIKYEKVMKQSKKLVPTEKDPNFADVYIE